MSPTDIILTIALAALLVLACALSLKLETAHEVLEKTSQECCEQRMRVSTVCQWAALNLGERHPEVELVCKTIETAFLSGGMPDAKKLEQQLDALKPHLIEEH